MQIRTQATEYLEETIELLEGYDVMYSGVLPLEVVKAAAKQFDDAIDEWYHSASTEEDENRLDRHLGLAIALRKTLNA